MSEILDITQAQAQLQTHGWIARKSEAFHHLPPPALETWLGTEPAAVARPMGSSVVGNHLLVR